MKLLNLGSEISNPNQGFLWRSLALSHKFSHTTLQHATALPFHTLSNSSTIIILSLDTVWKMLHNPRISWQSDK